MKIVADAHIPLVEHYFEVYGELILKPGRAMTYQDVKDADILLVRSITCVNQELLSNSKVKFVGSVTAGADHLDTKWLDAAGILWSVAEGFNAPPVADTVISIIAALQKNNFLSQKSLRAAVIGVGHVGQRVVDRLKLLNFDVVVCDPLRAENEKDFSSVPIEEITDCDLLSLHVPLTRTGQHATYHLIEKNFLKRQKANCVLLDTSRGSVIHPEHLKHHGKNLCWCLDVWENEPWIDKEILASALIATPHIAGYSMQSKQRGIAMIYQAACQSKVILPLAITALPMPEQTISFQGQLKTWQDVVLAIFDPLAMTEKMKATLLPKKEYGPMFDSMRHQFTHRHEFAYTAVQDVRFDELSTKYLAGLGLQGV